MIIPAFGKSGSVLTQSQKYRSLTDGKIIMIKIKKRKMLDSNQPPQVTKTAKYFKSIQYVENHE